MRNTFLEVDLHNFKENIKTIKKLNPGKELMPVIKANAYGTYLNTKIDILNEFNVVAVALVSEAIELRNNGYQKDIFVLNQPLIEEIPSIIENNITIGISSIEFIKELNNITKQIKVHLELETGMNRTGIKIEDINNYLDIITNKNILIKGIYTHLSSADDNEEYTLKQIELFTKGVNIIKDRINTIEYIHFRASNGIINYPSNIDNLIRPGIIMHGYLPYKEANIKLLPVTKLKSKISFIKEIEANTCISYNRRFTSSSKMTIATIPIGYADGIRRSLTNRGHVVINNKLCPIVGSVCMDSFMVDVTGIENVKVGDNVYIWDNNLITLEDIADICGTINYEILSCISNRVPRVFIGD